MHNKHIKDHTNNNDQVLKDTLLKGKNMEKCKNCDNKVYNNHRHCKDCLDKRTKQTSGKWVVRQEGTDHIYWRVYDSNGQVVINTAFDKEIAEQIVKDHNTAPGMFDALGILEDQLQSHMDDENTAKREIPFLMALKHIADRAIAEARKGE